jgi:dUTP pyrophosphatase
MLSGAEIHRQDIIALVATADASAQVQPNGVDLSLDAIWRFAEQGALGVSNADRYRPAREELDFDAGGWIELSVGTYGVRYGERVALPNDCGGLCFPRSSLLRMGIHVPTAVWDAGYVGRGEGLLVVGNAHGARLQRGARIAQLVVFRLNEAAAEGYSGRYQHENT